MRFGFVAALLLAVSAAPVSARAEPLNYTYPGNPVDAEFRAIAQALFEDHAGWPEISAADCSIKDAGAAKKLEDAFRKARQLPAGTPLHYASCEVISAEICHRSFYSGTDKCSAGDADMYFQEIDVAVGGTNATAVGLLAYFGKKGRQSGKVVQIFTYEFGLTKEAEEWRVAGKEFKKMSDL
jgi:hypothetical protein